MSWISLVYTFNCMKNQGAPPPNSFSVLVIVEFNKIEKMNGFDSQK